MIHKDIKCLSIDDVIKGLKGIADPRLIAKRLGDRQQRYVHDERPTWVEYWMMIARQISTRSHDPNFKVGAIIVPEDNTGIYAQGYNGNWKGGPNQVDSTSPGESGTVHAEQNALIRCPFHTVQKKHMYVTLSPCVMCAKLSINAGISKIVYDVPYRDDSGIKLLQQAGIEVLSFQEARYLCKK